MAAATEDSMEARVARLKSDLAHVRSDIAEMKLDIRELRTRLVGIQADLSGLKTELAGVRGAIEHSTRVSQLWTVTVAAALLGVMSRGFGWL